MQTAGRCRDDILILGAQLNPQPLDEHAPAKGSTMAKTAICSGEGGIVPEEMEASYKYIFEYVPNCYSATPEIAAIRN